LAERSKIRRCSFDDNIPPQQPSDRLLLKIERQKDVIETLNTEIQELKRVNATMVTLVRVKEQEISLMKRPPMPKTDQAKMMKSIKR
jgi:hypothetical protein